MWIVCPPGAVLLLFIMTLFLLFMVQYYGDIIKPLVTQPLSNRPKKTENANIILFDIKCYRNHISSLSNYISY
ncbi:hypothetical protein DWX40_10370 [Bacteroides stercoris]|uniref:Uncharacterized protein n=1 Tax=Bacteroides caccae TaxID=47678 RepID=A0A414FN53_9BACE|nr:hypothetical protein DWX40_10370 [Bacteroides stercoris]RHD51034.1 hypothetical protein DW794_05400 [Bacteroides caccae]